MSQNNYHSMYWNSLIHNYCHRQYSFFHIHHRIDYHNYENNFAYRLFRILPLLSLLLFSIHTCDRHPLASIPKMCQSIWLNP